MDVLEQDVIRQLRDIDQQQDPVARAQMATSLLHRLGVVTHWVVITRAKALLELRARGHRASEIGRLLGLTRQQAHRLLREAAGRDYQPETDAGE